MSFASEVKDELTHVPPECSHCEKATLAALVRIEGTLFVSGPERYRMEIATDVPSVARLVIRLLHTLYKLRTDLTVRRSVLHKTPNYLIEVPAQAGLAPALHDMGVLSPDGGLEMGISADLVAKRCCAAAYLRGAFLGSGFISNPRSDFHFEIIVESAELANGLVDLMAERGISARIMQRRSSYMVYLKSGNAILEFLAFAGAHHAALVMEEERVVKSVRNDVNRAINAELANQQKASNAAVEQLFAIGAHHAALVMEEERVVKSVRNDVNRAINAELANQQKASNAAVEQLFAIRVVLEHYGMENLPPALQEFIKLRVTYPDASLKELGQHSTPPLSKSAVYHRVRRLESMAREVQGKGGVN